MKEEGAKVLKNPEFIVTQNGEREVLADNDLLVVDGRIESIEPGIDTEGREEVDMSGKLVMPGLVNCHTHVSMTVLRGISDDLPLQQWLEKVMEAESRMSRGQVRDGAELGIREMLKTGTTCFNDMYDPEEAVMEATSRYGIRAVLAHGIIDADGGLDEKVAKVEEFFQAAEEEQRIEPAVAPHAVYTCSDEALESMREISEEHGALIHTHASETREENQDFREERGRSPVEHLDSLGLLTGRTVLAHCTHLSGEDVQLIADSGSSVAHNPCANLKLGSGRADVPALRGSGVSVGLGTDGPASNNSLSMLEEAKFASLSRKVDRPEEVTARHALDMATREAADVLGLEGQGRLEEGTPADIAAVRIDEGMEPAARESMVSHLVFGSPAVTDTMVAGEWKQRRGDLTLEPRHGDPAETFRNLVS